MSLMVKLWAEAVKAARKGDVREAYLLTVAGNLVEGITSIEPKDRVIVAAIRNADEIAEREGWGR